MQRDRITITKDLIPYNFNIMLAGELFNIEVGYNEKHDFFTLRLSKDNKVICEGEPIVYGVPLFQDVYKAGEYPAFDIIPIDESGEQNTVTFKTLEETVFLIVDNIGGDDLEQ